MLHLIRSLRYSKFDIGTAQKPCTEKFVKKSVWHKKDKILPYTAADRK